MKLYSEEQVNELLKSQREMCKKFTVPFVSCTDSPALPEPAMEVEDDNKYIYSCKECGVFVFTADGKHCINGHLYFPPALDSKQTKP